MKARRGITGTTQYRSHYDLAAQGIDLLDPPSAFSRTRHEAVVYYMRMDRLVKIGWTVNIKQRVAHVGPQGVMAVERGGKNTEERRHIEFAHLRSHLEWFWLRPALVDHIIQVRADFELHVGMSTEQWLQERKVVPAATFHQGPPADA